MEKILRTVYLNREAVDAITDFRIDNKYWSSSDFVNEALAIQLYNYEGTGPIANKLIRSMLSVSDKQAQDIFILRAGSKFDETEFEYDDSDDSGLIEFMVAIDPELAIDIKLKLLRGYSLSELVSESICRFMFIIDAAVNFYIKCNEKCDKVNLHSNEYKRDLLKYGVIDDEIFEEDEEKED